jgi:hypothetical protein
VIVFLLSGDRLLILTKPSRVIIAAVFGSVRG